MARSQYRVWFFRTEKTVRIPEGVVALIRLGQGKWEYIVCHPVPVSKRVVMFLYPGIENPRPSTCYCSWRKIKLLFDEFEASRLGYWIRRVPGQFVYPKVNRGRFFTSF